MNSTSIRSTKRSVSPLAVVLLTVMWVLLWGDLSWGNLLAGLALALLITWVVPMPRGPQRRLTVRPLAAVHLMSRFAWDVVEASAHIVAVIWSGRTPREAIIRVQTRAQSDSFLAATAGFTALVPGSIVIDAHRMTGILYIHVFDVEEGDEALEQAHQRVLDQEERLLRAFATRQELMDAGLLDEGFRP